MKKRRGWQNAKRSVTSLLATAGRARVRGSSAEADRATAPSVPHSGREGVIEFQLEAAAAESGTDHENLTGRRVPGPARQRPGVWKSRSCDILHLLVTSLKTVDILMAHE